MKFIPIPTSATHKMHTIAVLMTVFNRKEVTIRCLRSLFAALNKIKCCEVEIFLTDDKSTDGTSDAVKCAFPQVNIINGNGRLYWNRGMLLAWNFAATKNDFDFYIWLNDDTILFDSAILSLIDSSSVVGHSAIISGAFRSEAVDTPTYGGVQGDRILTPNGELQEFELLNGNLTLIPRDVYNTVGMLDSTFLHGVGDYDYGLRAGKLGIKLYLAPVYVGYCERHDTLRPKCYDHRYSLLTRFKFLYSPLGPNPFANARYYIRHYSFGFAFRFIVTTNLVTTFPFLLRSRSRIQALRHRFLSR